MCSLHKQSYRQQLAILRNLQEIVCNLPNVMELVDVISAMQSSGLQPNSLEINTVEFVLNLLLPQQKMQNVPLWGGALSIRMPPRFKDISKFRQVPDTQEVFVDEQTDQSVILELLEYRHDVADNKSAKFFFQDLMQANEDEALGKGMRDSTHCVLGNTDTTPICSSTRLRLRHLYSQVAPDKLLKVPEIYARYASHGPSGLHTLVQRLEAKYQRAIITPAKMREHLALSASLVGGFQCVTKFYSRAQQKQTPSMRRGLDLVWVCVANIRLPRLKTDLLVSINTPLPSGVRDAEELSPLADAATRASRVRALESELAGRYGTKEMEATRLLCRMAKSLRIHNTGLFVV